MKRLMIFLAVFVGVTIFFGVVFTWCAGFFAFVVEEPINWRIVIGGTTLLSIPIGLCAGILVACDN